jgi:hypothetical protein
MFEEYAPAGCEPIDSDADALLAGVNIFVLIQSKQSAE